MLQFGAMSWVHTLWRTRRRRGGPGSVGGSRRVDERVRRDDDATVRICLTERVRPVHEYWGMPTSRLTIRNLRFPTSNSW
jgi:hypothetical protein